MKKRNLFIFSIIFIIFISWLIILYHYSPEKIVEKVGVSNVYLVLGLMALIGGTSIFLPIPYYLLTISLGAAGLNPFLLGICAGVGTLLGDTTSYYIAYKGREIVPKKHSIFFQRIFDWAVKKNPIRVQIFTFLYTAIVPFSDDLIMVPAGVIKYPFWKLAISAGLGKIVFNTILAFSGLYGFSLFFIK